MYECMHKMTQHNFDCKIVYNNDAKSINYDTIFFKYQWHQDLMLETFTAETCIHC